ncbi:MAG TPA: hypothetical protein VJ438_01610 [Candidatus Nanoarchaeia archaeon]|nr:hypothetical protein [Candidatus Nanoarchaeia archaeon]
MNYILGSGITGLIASWYLNMKMIGEDYGQCEKRYGPRVLKKTEAVDKFLSSVGINIKEKEYKAGYFYNKEVNKDCTEVMRFSYISKTRGKEWMQFISSGMNDGNNITVGYPLDYIFTILENTGWLRAKTVKMKIDKIDFLNRIIHGENLCVNLIEELGFDVLVNTLPKGVFNSLCSGVKRERLYTDEGNIYICVVSSNDFNFMEGYEWMCFPEKSIPFYRITRMEPTQTIYSVESMVPIHNIEALLSCHEITKDIIYGGKITFKEDKEYGINDDKLFHIGRYAKEDNSSRAESLIKMFEDMKERYGECLLSMLQ